MNEIPQHDRTPEVLIEKVDKEERFRIWCPFCVTYHYHGAVLGHRVAHCSDVTPFTRTGYILRKPSKQ